MLEQREQARGSVETSRLVEARAAWEERHSVLPRHEENWTAKLALGATASRAAARACKGRRTEDYRRRPRDYFLQRSTRIPSRSVGGARTEQPTAGAPQAERAGRLRRLAKSWARVGDRRPAHRQRGCPSGGLPVRGLAPWKRLDFTGRAAAPAGIQRGRRGCAKRSSVTGGGAAKLCRRGNGGGPRPPTAPPAVLGGRRGSSEGPACRQAATGTFGPARVDGQGADAKKMGVGPFGHRATARHRRPKRRDSSSTGPRPVAEKERANSNGGDSMRTNPKCSVGSDLFFLGRAGRS